MSATGRVSINDTTVERKQSYLILAILSIGTEGIYLYLRKKSASFVLLTLREIKAFEQSHITSDFNSHSQSVHSYGEDSIPIQTFDSRVVQVNKPEITVTRDEFFVNLKCSFSIPPAKRGDFRLQAVGFQHPSGFRFGQEFALPACSNRSYFVRAAEEEMKRTNIQWSTSFLVACLTARTDQLTASYMLDKPCPSGRTS
ncbi:unnamed protein product [Allacma fusca]|uniref:Uncharacterized protein n=1 Tax=Allacma fusca TaxID=39272 RepID=A0A8J2LEF0_9HEXA|nr:unnamed protein product [Allacma fusca]